MPSTYICKYSDSSIIKTLTTLILAITGLMKHSIYGKYLACQDFNDWRTLVGPNHPDKQGLTVTEKFYIPKFMHIKHIRLRSCVIRRSRVRL